MKRNVFFTLMIAIAIFVACNTPSDTNSENTIVDESADSMVVHEPTPTVFYQTNLNDSLAYLLADTITYDVVVRNPDSLDTWTDQCLNNLDVITMVDAVFDAVYKGKAFAVDYYTNDTLSMAQVKKIDKAHKRTTIGKMQFIEEWYIDNQTFAFGKKVKGIMLAYEVRNLRGEISGYKAGIKIMFNN